MEVRILLDKNVLIAGSIFASIEELERNIKHTFYEISARLLNKINENREVGCVTNEVEERSQKKLANCIEETIEENDNLPAFQELNNFYSIVSICNGKMEERISICKKVNLKKESYKEYISEVTSFYENLKDKFDEVFSESPFEKTKKVKKRSSSHLLDSKTLRSIKESKKDPAFNKLFWNIKKNPPKSEDKKLLSQAICLNNNQFEEKNVVIASTDQHFVKLRFIENSDHIDFIPNGIQNEFNIQCMWPDEVSKEFLE